LKKQLKTMKKIILILIVLCPFAGFSQTNQQIIQDYFNNSSNRSKLGLSKQDITDWTLVNEVNGSGTKITSSYVVQQYKGIEIFNALSNFSIKNGKIINVGDNFKRNIPEKINTTTPTISAIDALKKVYVNLGYENKSNFLVTKSKTKNSFMINDGLQNDPINATLVYQEIAGDKLRLAWSFEFYAPNGDNLWAVRIDAVNGEVLEKNDLTISCSFEPFKNHIHNHFNFYKSFYKSNTQIIVAKANKASYKVIPFNYTSPDHVPFELITTSGDALASPNGWHDTNPIGGVDSALKYTITRGNNVYAQEDAKGTNNTSTPGFSPDGGAALNFDFPYGGVREKPDTYVSAATTNLFYGINVMHDVLYQYGFDEKSANFQQQNYGKGGLEGDYILADAQDSYLAATPRLNNANFSSPKDGSRPRVQMFLWNRKAPINLLTVISPSNIAGGIVSNSNNFIPSDNIPVPVAPKGISTKLVLYKNNTTVSPNSACDEAINSDEISGKIVLIKMGECLSKSKVKKAQDAGAVAVILMNNVPNVNTPPSLTDVSQPAAGITIPAISITKEAGDKLITELLKGDVNVKIEAPTPDPKPYLYADGDFDNGIIAHEVGHGISNRLIGGGTSGCMGNNEQMGEGWSDWFTLMFQLKAGDKGTDGKGVGTYALNEPVNGLGIREYKYSTDFAINPRTLKNSNFKIPEPPNNRHRYKIGEVWTSVLWDLTWAYINKYGYDENIYTGKGGNNKVMRLVLDALKLETCNNSSIINGRDRLIEADQATTGGADFCLITEVFTKRGMGLNATSGSANDSNDQVEDFTPFPAGPKCSVLGINYIENEDLIKVYPTPSKDLINIKINQFIGKLEVKIFDLNGRTVYSQVDNNFNVEKSINLNYLQSGIYIVKIAGDQINFTERIIIE
jgi:extracellular elastinolytic metalloproteinase